MAAIGKFQSLLENQQWYANNQEVNTVGLENSFHLEPKTSPPLEVTPLPFHKYPLLPKTWNGWPVFERDQKLVQLFDVCLPYPSDPDSERVACPWGVSMGRIAWPIDNQSYPTVKMPKEMGDVAAGIPLVVRPAFTNIKYYAAIEFGFPRTPIVIEGTMLPPKGVLAPVTCYGSMVGEAKENWFTLTPLSLEKCKELPGWDGLPVFANKKGQLVRPYIVLNQDGTPAIWVAYRINPYYRGPMVIVQLYGKELGNVTKPSIMGPPQKLCSRPLFNDPM